MQLHLPRSVCCCGGRWAVKHKMWRGGTRQVRRQRAASAVMLQVSGLADRVQPNHGMQAAGSNAHAARCLGTPSLQCVTVCYSVVQWLRRAGGCNYPATTCASRQPQRGQRRPITSGSSVCRLRAADIALVSWAIVLMISARANHDSWSRGRTVKLPSGLVSVAAFGGLLTWTLVPFYNHGNLPAVSSCHTKHDHPFCGRPGVLDELLFHCYCCCSLLYDALTAARRVRDEMPA
jgi:hypothetical protein